MPAIKHHKILRDGDYFKGGALPCVVRERPPLPLSVLGFPLMDEIFPEDPASVHANTLGRVTRSNLTAVLRLIDLIRREEHLDQPLRRITCESLFMSLLLLLARSTKRVSVPSRESPVQKEIDFIAKNLSRKITLEELCGVSGKSARTLHREFRKAVGKSPGDYIIDMRIAKAKTLLGRKGSTLKKVAAKTGFCSSAHLSRTLHRTKAPGGQ